MLIQVLNKPKILLYLTSIQQNLSNQIIYTTKFKQSNQHIIYIK